MADGQLLYGPAVGPRGPRPSSAIVEGPLDWQLVGSRANPGFGRGPDWLVGDFAPDRDPDVPWVTPSDLSLPIGENTGTNRLPARYAWLKGSSTADVTNNFRYWFCYLGTGQLGQDMISYFVRPGRPGRLLHHPAGSELSNDMVRVTKVRDFIARIKQSADQQLRAQRPYGVVTAAGMQLPADLTLSTFERDATYTAKLRALVGGIQGVEVFARRLRDTGPAEGVSGYRLDLMLRIKDDFGVGSDDLYQEGLIAMWMLQHQRAVGVPYVNMIDIQFPIAGRW